MRWQLTADIALGPYITLSLLHFCLENGQLWLRSSQGSTTGCLFSGGAQEDTSVTWQRSSKFLLFPCTLNGSIKYFPKKDFKSFISLHEKCMKDAFQVFWQLCWVERPSPLTEHQELTSDTYLSQAPPKPSRLWKIMFFLSIASTNNTIVLPVCVSSAAVVGLESRTIQVKSRDCIIPYGSSFFV